MRINKFGQVTNKSNDLLLTPQQEEFMKSLLDNGKATSLEYAAEHTDDSQDANLMQALQYYFSKTN